MFDLESAITIWREQMIAAGIQTPVPMEELESHLRDEIEQSMAAGRPAENAFAKATENIGAAGSLKPEFSKIGKVKGLLNVLEIFYYLAIFAVMAGITYSLSKREMSPAWRFAGLTNVGLIGAVFLVYEYFQNRLPISRQTLGIIEISFGITAVIFGILLNPGGSLNYGWQWVLSNWSTTLIACGTLFISKGIRHLKNRLTTPKANHV
jgi:hypothetical protein